MSILFKFQKTPVFSAEPAMATLGMLRYFGDWSYAAHSHDYVEILYILKGCMNITFDNNNIRQATEGCLVVYNVGMDHQESSCVDNQSVTVYTMSVGNVNIKSLKRGTLVNNNPIIYTNEYRFTIESYFNDLFVESSSHDIHVIRKNQKLLRTLLEFIVQLANRGDAEENDTYIIRECKRVKDYIDQNYKKEIDLDKLATLVHISKDYLSHAFKLYSGVSPINYLIKCRINNAKRLLSETNFSIAMISKMVGYENPVYFSQAFKKTTGMSPSKFKDILK